MRRKVADVDFGAVRAALAIRWLDRIVSVLRAIISAARVTAAGRTKRRTKQSRIDALSRRPDLWSGRLHFRPPVFASVTRPADCAVQAPIRKSLRGARPAAS